MKCFGFLFILFSYNVYSYDFTLTPSNDDLNGMPYYSLIITDGIRSNHVDVALEGNSKLANIRDKYIFNCPWGKTEGVTVSMTSSDNDGIMRVVNTYFFDENLKNILAESHVFFDKESIYNRLNLKSTACAKKGNIAVKDPLNDKDYIPNQVVVLQGPFPLNSIKSKYVFFTRESADTKVIVEGAHGYKFIDRYKDMGGVASSIETVFFTKRHSNTIMVVLVSWDTKSDKGKYYKVYAYSYGESVDIKSDDKINNDSNLSGYERNPTIYKFRTAEQIKTYLKSQHK